jgi:hypothetical protein
VKAEVSREKSPKKARRDSEESDGQAAAHVAAFNGSSRSRSRFSNSKNKTEKSDSSRQEGKKDHSKEGKKETGTFVRRGDDIDYAKKNRQELSKLLQLITNLEKEGVNCVLCFIDWSNFFRTY